MEATALVGKEWKVLESRPVVAGRARTICIANQKGGVAKTTTTVNLAAGLALRGHPVLVVDLDPQANATTGLGVDHRALARSTYDLLAGAATLDEVVTKTPIDNLEIAPGSVDLAGAEIELVGTTARERRLAETLDAVDGRYELVFIDCPPSLGLLTVNALTAAQDLIVPVQCEYYALEGLGQLLGTAERIRGSLNPELRIAGFLLTMYDARTKLSSQVAQDVRRHFGEYVFATIIPRSVRLSEAPSYGEPVVTLDPASRGAVAHRLLAAEIEQRYGLEVHPPPPPEDVAAGQSHPIGFERTPSPGPRGRGYGVVAPEPEDLREAWPPSQPWSGQ